MSDARDVRYEIQQLAMAIDYFERAIETAYTQEEVDKHKRTIHNLTQQMRDLERKRDEQTV